MQARQVQAAKISEWQEHQKMLRIQRRKKRRLDFEERQRQKRLAEGWITLLEIVDTDSAEERDRRELEAREQQRIRRQKRAAAMSMGEEPQ